MLARVKLCWQASASGGRIACSAVACRCIQLVTCTQREPSLITLQQRGNCDHSGPTPTPRLTRRSWWAALLTRPLLMLFRAPSPAPRDRHRTTHAHGIAAGPDRLDLHPRLPVVPGSLSPPAMHVDRHRRWRGTCGCTMQEHSACCCERNVIADSAHNLNLRHGRSGPSLCLLHDSFTTTKLLRR